jgi:hypothetical protein
MVTVQPPTLLDLVQTLNEFVQTDDEVVAAVAQLVNSGQVLLSGNFTGARITLSTPVPRAKRSPRPKEWGKIHAMGQW